jgi:hypothetical protein
MLFSSTLELRGVLLCLAMLVTSTISRGAIVLNNLTPYSQDFNFLANSRDINLWSDNAPTQSAGGSPGWFWQNSLTPDLPMFYAAGSGVSAEDLGRAYALMHNNTDEQAMGSLNGVDNPYTAWGVVFRNNTGQTITSVNLTYFGEQWRRARAPDGLQFSLKVSDSPITDLVPAQATPAGWTADAAMSFSVPVVLAGQTRIVLDGNVAPHRQQISGLLPITVAPGQYFAFRWHDSDGAVATGAALAIDDLLVNFNVAAAASLPETSAFALCGAASAFFGVAAWRRRPLRMKVGPRNDEWQLCPSQIHS